MTDKLLKPDGSEYFNEEAVFTHNRDLIRNGYRGVLDCLNELKTNKLITTTEYNEMIKVMKNNKAQNILAQVVKTYFVQTKEPTKLEEVKE